MSAELPSQVGKQPRVVIVGGGFGGLEAARGLRHAPVQVTVIDRTNHHLFQPLLYQVATAALSPGDIAEPIRAILSSQQNVEVLMGEVTGISLEERQVLLGDRREPYDYLVLATGSRESYFGHPEWDEYAPGMKSLRDATAIRQRILQAFEEAEANPDRARELLTFVLVGAGPTGVEMAGAIAELARHSLRGDFRHIVPAEVQTLLLEAGPRILPAFPESLAAKAEKALRLLGVQVRTNAAVESVLPDGVMAAGEWIRSQTVLWTAGVQATPGGKWLNAETDRAGRIRVLPDLSVPGQPSVFAIGDLAHLEQDGKLLPALAPVAMQEGRFVAALIRRRAAGQPTPRSFVYHDKGSLATVGRGFAIVKIGPLRLAGVFAWILWLTVHILYLVGFRNRILVLMQWAWAYFTYQRGVRLISPEWTRR